MNNVANYKMELVRRQHLENEYYCFDFKKPDDFVFEEGQFCLFEIIHKVIEGRAVRAFSIASTNDESVIRIATRIVDTCSAFKEELRTMPIGEAVSVTKPKGKFVLDEQHDGVFIAGGIGITPIRSMLLSKERNSLDRHDVLIYSELEECYPFNDELKSLKNLDIQYAADIEPTQKLIIDNAKKHQNTVVYYVSGSPGFVNGISGLLKENGVAQDHIRYDVFTGY